MAGLVNWIRQDSWTTESLAREFVIGSWSGDLFQWNEDGLSLHSRGSVCFSTLAFKNLQYLGYLKGSPSIPILFCAALCSFTASALMPQTQDKSGKYSVWENRFAMASRIMEVVHIGLTIRALRHRPMHLAVSLLPKVLFPCCEKIGKVVSRALPARYSNSKWAPVTRCVAAALSSLRHSINLTALSFLHFNSKD